MTRSSFKSNFSAGIVVFLIALPLCLGIALASGAPPLSGILAGIIGGIVVGVLSGSHISVAGPAAGLTGVIFVAITQLGSFELFLCAGVIAGVIQLILGFVRAGSIAEYIPVAVIEGMLAAIGVTIILQQIPAVFGQTDSIWHIREWMGHIHLGALVISVLSGIILLFWSKIPVVGQLKILPAALVAVIVGVLINEFFVHFIHVLAVPEHLLVRLPEVHRLADFEEVLTHPDWSGLMMGDVWITGATIAIIGSIETLLSIEASDRLDIYRRITDNNQELRAQGTANVICSFVGGLPVTSVIVRSTANISAGATHKMATITHGVLMLLCIVFIPFLLNKIPLAVLASVLILVGYHLTKVSTFIKMWKKGIFQFIPFIATFFAVISLDLLKGVGVGLVVSIFFILQRNMKRAYYMSREELENAQTITLRLAEEVSFLNKAAIKKTLKNIQPGSQLIIDASRSNYIAIDVLETIKDFVRYTAPEKNISIKLRGFKANYDGKSSEQIQVE